MTNPDFIRYFARHFVSMGWFDVSPAWAAENEGRGRHFAISGFIVAVKDTWYLITAGHILEDIEAAQKRGQVLTKFHVDDGWAKTATYGPQIFDFNGATKLYHHDAELGTDFAAITLDTNTRERIKANGVEPLDERMWRNELPQCNVYFICGIPSVWKSTRPLSTAVMLTTNLVLFGLNRLDSPPDALVKPLERLYFKRADTLVGEDGKPLDSLDGMSGSPIFGATQKTNGFSYWLLGIQSAVDEETGRILIASPFLTLGLFLEHEQSKVVDA